MLITLTGVLTDPLNNLAIGAEIRFSSIATSPTVLDSSTASATTNTSGAYTITVVEGRYDISVRHSGSKTFTTLAKGVVVDELTAATTLNELIRNNVTESDLTPAIIVEFRELRAETAGYRDESAISASNAATSESNAATSETNAGTSAANAATSESNAATSETNSSASELKAEKWAEELVDVAVEPGKFSALHHATKSIDSAAAAATSESNASTSETNSANSATAASDSATAASLSETNASTSETNSAASATAAATSETNASTSETNAANSATAASISETNAGNSATAAALSETNAASSEAAALISENNSSASATAAALSETNAATSETNASNSATAAALSETNAATSAANALISENNSSASATAASGSATAASLSESNASTSETNAGASATAAAASESNAAGSATAAITSETNAANSASAAATSETNSANSASAAALSETNAASSEAAAAASLADFQDRYHGPLAVAPTVASAGDLYFDTALVAMQVYTGTEWINASSVIEGIRARFEFVASGTTFSGTDKNGKNLAFDTSSSINVYRNGVRLAQAHYTADATTNSVEIPSAVAGDMIEIEAFGNFKDSALDTLDGRYAEYTRSRKNLIINGGFDIWQRGTSFTSGVYSADRFAVWPGMGGTFSVTRQNFTLGQSAVPGNPKYFLRYQQTGAATTDAGGIWQAVEGVHTLSGRTVTVSFWAKSNAPRLLQPKLEQYFGTGGTPSERLDIQLPNVSLTTSWQRFTITVDLPPIDGKTVGTDGNDALTFTLYSDSRELFINDFAQIQLEIGDTATDFENRTIGEELALCQRYYEIVNARFAAGGGGAGSGIMTYAYSTCKRTVPFVQVVGASGTWQLDYIWTQSVAINFNPGIIAGELRIDAEL